MAVRGCSFALLCAGRSSLRSYLGLLQSPSLPFTRLTASEVKLFHCFKGSAQRTYHFQPITPSLSTVECTPRSVLRRNAFTLKQGASYSKDAPNPSTEQPKGTSTGQPPAKSYTQRIKVILKEYGPVAVAFHTVVALFSIGTCYFLVSK